MRIKLNILPFCTDIREPSVESGVYYNYLYSDYITSAPILSSYKIPHVLPPLLFPRLLRPPYEPWCDKQLEAEGQPARFLTRLPAPLCLLEGAGHHGLADGGVGRKDIRDCRGRGRAGGRGVALLTWIWAVVKIAAFARGFGENVGEEDGIFDCETS